LVDDESELVGKAAGGLVNNESELVGKAAGGSIGTEPESTGGTATEVPGAGEAVGAAGTEVGVG
jgi:hypothetical protein